MKLYGLYSDKQKCLMGFFVKPNYNGGFYGNVTYSLTSYGRDNLWVTEFKDVAEAVNGGPTEWYKVSYNHPEYNVEYYGKLKVVDMNNFSIEEQQ